MLVIAHAIGEDSMYGSQMNGCVQWSRNWNLNFKMQFNDSISPKRSFGSLWGSSDELIGLLEILSLNDQVSLHYSWAIWSKAEKEIGPWLIKGPFSWFDGPKWRGVGCEGSTEIGKSHVFVLVLKERVDEVSGGRNKTF